MKLVFKEQPLGRRIDAATTKRLEMAISLEMEMITEIKPGLGTVWGPEWT
jgi:hypothetical protein